MSNKVTITEAKKRVKIYSINNADKATTFNSLFRVVMKELKNGSEFDKGLYIAIKKSGSTNTFKNWIAESIQDINTKF